MNSSTTRRLDRIEERLGKELHFDDGLSRLLQESVDKLIKRVDAEETLRGGADDESTRKDGQ